MQFIKNAQRTQHENAKIPVIPFALNDYSEDEPTEFEFIYTLDGIKYWYSFAATKEKIYKEYLYHAPKGQKALVLKEKINHLFYRGKGKEKVNQRNRCIESVVLFVGLYNE